MTGSRRTPADEIPTSQLGLRFLLEEVLLRCEDPTSVSFDGKLTGLCWVCMVDVEGIAPDRGTTDVDRVGWGVLVVFVVDFRHT